MENKYHIGYHVLLVTSNFSFSHNVFHSYISLVSQNVVLCGNGLKKKSLFVLPINTSQSYYLKTLVTAITPFSSKFSNYIKVYFATSQNASRLILYFYGKYLSLNPLPNDKIIDWSKLGAFTYGYNGKSCL